MTKLAQGEFDVTVERMPPYHSDEGATLGFSSIKKQFHGDLQGSASVEMISAGSSVKGSAAYVAIERVEGALHGRSGTFVLQHSGTMTRGKPELTVSVVPDTGTGELKGLAGKMTIDIRDGRHFYGFDYSLGGSD